MSNSGYLQPKDQMLEIATALAILRDSWVNLSLAFSDLLTEQESTRRAKVLNEVEQYLCRLRESDRRNEP